MYGRVIKIDDQRFIIEEIMKSEAVKSLLSKMEKAVERGIRKGVEKGVEKGIVKGLEKSLDKTLDSKVIEEKIKIIQNLLISGLDEILISNCTGIGVEQIMEMKNRM